VAARLWGRAWAAVAPRVKVRTIPATVLSMILDMALSPLREEPPHGRNGRAWPLLYTKVSF